MGILKKSTQKKDFSIKLWHLSCGNIMEIAASDIIKIRNEFGSFYYISKCKRCGKWRGILAILIPKHVRASAPILEEETTEGFDFRIENKHSSCGHQMEISYKDIREVSVAAAKYIYVYKCKNCGTMVNILPIRIPRYIKLILSKADQGSEEYIQLFRERGTIYKKNPEYEGY